MGVRPWSVTANGLSLSVRLTPKGGRDAIDGAETRADGHPVLKVRVRAAPTGGEANDALVALLAKSLGVARSDVSLVAGATARIKRVTIAGNGAGINVTGGTLTLTNVTVSGNSATGAGAQGGGVNFAAGSATIDPDSQAVLNSAAASILQVPAPVKVVGYTDDQGTEEENLLLSQQRADAVKAYLVGRGVPATSLTASRSMGRSETTSVLSCCCRAMASVGVRFQSCR